MLDQPKKHVDGTLFLNRIADEVEAALGERYRKEFIHLRLQSPVVNYLTQRLIDAMPSDEYDKLFQQSEEVFPVS